MNNEKEFFDDFMKKFSKIEATYIPIDKSVNDLRNYGTITNAHHLYIEDVLYLYDKNFTNIENIIKKIVRNNNEGNRNYDFNDTKMQLNNLQKNENYMRIENNMINVIRAYFYIRNAGYNLFRNEHSYSIFIRRKHFNRKKNDSISNLRFVSKDIDVANAFTSDDVYCVLSNEQFTFLKVECVFELEKNSPIALLKKKYLPK